ncbi:MAG TPA: cytidylate kinase family protein, partial [Gemmatimonadaceae bacterium]
AVLEEAAAAPPVIIVGHGAQAIFAQRPRTLRIRLVAPLADRSRRIARRLGLSEKDATELARHFDRDRAHYVKEFIGRDVSDPLLYTWQVNTAEVSLPEIVPIVQLMLAERTS